MAKPVFQMTVLDNEILEVADFCELFLNAVYPCLHLMNTDF